MYTSKGKLLHEVLVVFCLFVESFENEIPSYDTHKSKTNRILREFHYNHATILFYIYNEAIVGNVEKLTFILQLSRSSKC